MCVDTELLTFPIESQSGVKRVPDHNYNTCHVPEGVCTLIKHMQSLLTHQVGSQSGVRRVPDHATGHSYHTFHVPEGVCTLIKNRQEHLTHPVGSLSGGGGKCPIMLQATIIIVFMYQKGCVP